MRQKTGQPKNAINVAVKVVLSNVVCKPVFRWLNNQLASPYTGVSITFSIMAAPFLTFSLPDLVSNPPHSQPYNSCDIFGIGSTYNLLIDILLSSYHLSA